MIQVHILYSGTVQGVGFRYTTVSYARQYGLNGWVKNLADGGVELTAEGPEEKIKKFSQSLDRHFDGFIKNKVESFHPAGGQFKDFQVV